jgi:cell division protein FtsL
VGSSIYSFDMSSMKKRSFLFIFSLVLLLLAGIYVINEAHEQGILAENARTANETKEQMEYIQSLQAESESIFAQDQDVQDLLSENTSYRVYGEG